MACSTCDGYQLVDLDGDGIIDAPCPDCRANVERCRVHGRTLHDGRCGSCSSEAALAVEVIEARVKPVGHPLVGAVA